MAMKHTSVSTRFVVGMLLARVWASVGSAQERSEKLGTVHFPVSCSPVAQQQFERALAMLHSFFFPETVKAFTQVTQTDPTCAMGYWGLAMSTRPNPLIPLDVATLKRGWDVVEKAQAAGPKTPRERDYIAAMEAYYRVPEQGPTPARAQAYEQAMEQVYLRYPEDTEAAIFYALALNEATDHADRTYARQRKAGAILEKVFAEQPNHPGVAHYIIHSYDFPPLASQGLIAARAYAGIAPSAPHALHMPSHVFSMLGYWQESIPADRASLAASRAYAAANMQGAVTAGELHSMDFLAYAFLQTGQDTEAQRILEQRNAVQKFSTRFLPGDTAYAAIPVRFTLERGRWAEAAALPPVTSQFPAAEALVYFGRALGAARSGDLPAARQAIQKLEVLRDTLAQAKNGYWADQVEIQRRAATAWVARTEGREDDAVALMRSAADLEDASEKHIAMENRLFPMRALLGELLLELHEPTLALQAFEASLRTNPARFRSFYGAAKAAEQAGNPTVARGYYEKLIALAAQADPGRPELVEAKKTLMAKR
jgi:tetratricopeptide (TPR) repeat protein